MEIAFDTKRLDSDFRRAPRVKVSGTAEANGKKISKSTAIRLQRDRGGITGRWVNGFLTEKSLAKAIEKAKKRLREEIEEEAERFAGGL